MMPSIHDVEINVNAENCCNGCCVPIRKRRNPKTDGVIEKVDKVAKEARRTKSNPT